MTYSRLVFRLRAATALLACFAAGPLLAATAYSETWDANVAGWQQSTTASVVVHAPGEGNPGGALAIRRDVGGPSFDIGALTTLPAATGSFTGSIWTASFDVRLAAGTFTDGWLRFRYQDFTQNGWRYDLGAAFPTNDTWSTYTVTFDPSWTDLQAAANGWSQEGPPVPGWSTTMGDVFSTEVRFATTQESSLFYLDNFKLEPVPEPSTYALMAAGLLALGALARRRVRG